MSLRDLPAERIVAAIADAAARWADADFSPRVRALDAVAARTGYSLPVVEYAFDRLFLPLTPQGLRAAIEAELGSLRALDGFTSRPAGADLWARGVDRVTVVSSRTTVGVALWPAIFALCAKCDVTVKDREDHLVAAFFETLAQEHPSFERAAHADWYSHDRLLSALRDSDAVVAFGRTRTLRALREACDPQARFIAYGPKASAGYVAREALADLWPAREAARGAARDFMLYEGEGCLSLHVLFVERGGALSPREFADELQHECELASVEFPPPPKRDPAREAAVAAALETARFRQAQDQGAALPCDEGRCVLLFDPPGDAPPPFLPRVLPVHSVDAPTDALSYLRAHRVPLEAFAVAGQRDDVTQLAVDAGAARLTRFGELQSPPLAGRHGGRPRIAEFVRWIGRQ